MMTLDEAKELLAHAVSGDECVDECRAAVAANAVTSYGQAGRWTASAALATFRGRQSTTRDAHVHTSGFAAALAALAARPPGEQVLQFTFTSATALFALFVSEPERAILGCVRVARDPARTTLEDVVERLDTFAPGTTVWVRRPWTTPLACLLVEPYEHGAVSSAVKPEGYTYSLEVAVMRDVLRLLPASTPREERVRLLVHHAEHGTHPDWAAPLLLRFLAEECSAGLCLMLEAALDPAVAIDRQFEFNIFDVAIRHSDGSVVLDDILDVSEAGTQRLALADFAAALGRHAARIRRLA